MCGTGKKRYETPVDAMLSIQRIQGERDIDAADKYEKSFYECWACGGYHVTSWPTSEGP